MKENFSSEVQYENKKINTSYVMYVFYHYFVFIWLTDFVNLICLFLKLPQIIIVSHVLSGVMLLLLCIWDFKKFNIVAVRISFFDIAAILTILLLGFYKCVYPDTSHDVMTYHVLNQDPVWSTMEHSFLYYQISFPFADRLFYLFRMLGGYRLGTLVNALLLIVIYHQLKRTLTLLLSGTDINTSPHSMSVLISASCFGVLMLEAVLMELGTYMTDLVSIPLTLELICQMLEIKKEKIPLPKMVYFSACLAFIFLCKLTGAIIVVILLTAYLILARESMNRYKFICSLFAALLVILPFILFNLYTYGVPLYSAAGLFGSYSAGNGSGDPRFGGENLFQKLFWPVYMAWFPSSGRHMEIVDMPNYYPLAGIIVIAFELFRRKKSVFNKGVKIISIIALSSFYIWSFAGGPDRYKLTTLLLFGLIIAYAMTAFLFSRKRFKASLLGAVILVQSLGSLYFVMIENNNWQWAPSIIDQIAKNKNDYVKQLKWLGKDRGPLIAGGASYKTFAATDKPYSTWGKLINENADLYQLFAIDDEQKLSDILSRLAEEEIFTACSVNYLPACINSLDEYGLSVRQIQTFYDTYMGNVAVLRLEYLPLEKNRLYLLGKDSCVKVAGVKGGKIYQINALAQISPTVSWTSEASELTMYYLYKGQRYDVESITLSPRENSVFTATLDLSEMEEPAHVSLYFETSNNYGLDWNSTQIINPQISVIEDFVTNTR